MKSPGGPRREAEKRLGMDFGAYLGFWTSDGHQDSAGTPISVASMSLLEYSLCLLASPEPTPKAKCTPIGPRCRSPN